jgi:hypothetical protein
MIVRIESYFIHDVILSGKKCSKEELKRKLISTISKTDTIDFVPFFCRMFQFEEMPFTDDIEADFVIDLDTYLVYKPRYF